MIKRSTLLMVAAAILTTAVPAVAGATKATLPAGTWAPVGTQVTLTGSDFSQKSNLLGTITCETLNLNVSLTKNNGTILEASGSNSMPAQSGCKNGTKSEVITSFEISKLFSEAAGHVTLSFKMIIDRGPELTCTFTGTNVAGTFNLGANVLRFSGASGVTGTPAACGTETITAEFALEQKGTSTPVILD